MIREPSPSDSVIAVSSVPELNLLLFLGDTLRVDLAQVWRSQSRFAAAADAAVFVPDAPGLSLKADWLQAWQVAVDRAALKERSYHHPPSAEMLEMASEYGMLRWNLSVTGRRQARELRRSLARKFMEFDVPDALRIRGNPASYLSKSLLPLWRQIRSPGEAWFHSMHQEFERNVAKVTQSSLRAAVRSLPDHGSETGALGLIVCDDRHVLQRISGREWLVSSSWFASIGRG